MRSRLFRFGVITALAAPLTLALASPALAADDSNFAAVDAFVAGQVADAHLSGLALAVTRGTEVVHVRGFGAADPSGRPVTGQTPFVIGSLSKSFTAMAVMQLVRSGDVQLDAPVQTYIPGFRVANASASKEISVRELLNQTSGLPTSAGIAPLSGPVTTLEDQVDRLSSVSLSSSPGSRYEYSNSNYEVLGRLVEVVSGESYGDYVRQHIFEPLGMKNTFADVTAAKADGLAAPSTLWFGQQEALPAGDGFRADTVPAGFLISSAEDMGHYIAAQLNGGTYAGTNVLAPGLVDVMHTGTAAAGLSAQNGRYAMGWFVGPRGGVPNTIWHNGSAAGMHSMVVMVPGSDLGVVILTNTESVLYEFLARTDVIADNVAAMLTGRTGSGTLAGLYWGFDVFAALIVAVAARNLLTLITKGPRTYTGRFAGVRNVLFNWVVPMWRELWIPAGIVVGVPFALGAPWLGNLAGTDVGQFLLVTAGVLAAAGVFRVRLAINRLRRPAEEGSMTRSTMSAQLDS